MVSESESGKFYLRHTICNLLCFFFCVDPFLWVLTSYLLAHYKQQHWNYVRLYAIKYNTLYMFFFFTTIHKLGL